MDELNDRQAPERDKNQMRAIAKVQLSGMETATKFLEDILQPGIAAIDVEERDILYCKTEELVGYYIPGFLSSFRYLFYLFHDTYENKYSDFLAQINYMLAVADQSKKYLERRVVSEYPDTTSVVQTHLGYFWKNIDFLEYKLDIEDAEIIQLSFNSTIIAGKWTFVDKGYWFDLKSRKIHYTCKIRPMKVAHHIARHNTEFDVLKPEKLFVYPGKINRRIRWDAAKKRKTTPADFAVLIESAHADYTYAANKIKENFKDPLAERSPVLLIKLHKSFINGDYLVLEDAQGGLLTIADAPDDNIPTAELLQTILPARPTGYALLVELNDDLQSDLFSVKPLSLVTPQRIIRLSY